MANRLLAFFFPPKCVLCAKLLEKDETDLCRHCRETVTEYAGHKNKLSFLAQWTGLWYYKDDVRSSILRFKFGHRRSYAQCYGRLLAMKLEKEGWADTELLTWVPISRRRKFRRGYDQVELIANAAARELNCELVPTLRKIRHTKPQSTMGNAAHRRANVLGAYTVIDPDVVRGKQILILDDIVTTGATASECARVLLTAGAKEVKLATLAVANNKQR